MNLQDKLLISQLNISRWVAKVTDKKATKTVEQRFHTSQVGNFHKEIVGRQYLKDIDNISLEMRRFHNNHTLPWGENGDRILSIIDSNFENYKNEMLRLSLKFEEAVNAFVQIYPTLKEEAKKILNGLYNEDDYPTNIKSKFGVSVRYFPVPNPNDFRLNLSKEDKDSLTANLESTLNARFEDAIEDVWLRITIVLERMVERLKDPENSFKESLVSNISELTKIIPSLNINEDPRMEQICKDMKELLKSPDMLRNNPTIRKNTFKKANGILKQIETFGVVGKRQISF